MKTLRKSAFLATLLMFFALFLTSSEARMPFQKKASGRVSPKGGQVAAQLPFYFPEGIIQTTDPVDQFAEYNRYLTATYHCNQGDPQKGSFLLADNHAISVQTDIESTSSITNSKTKLKIILDNQVRVSDKIRVTTLCSQQFITEDQYKTEIAYLITEINQAADADYEYYKDLTERAIKARAEKLGISESDFKKILDDKDPNYGITFRELHRVPQTMRRSDFVPRELHLGYNPEIPGILGVTWLNTGIIYINPQAQMLDYLIGKPVVLAHEFIHGNSNMQKFPMSDGFDVEVFASIPEMLISDDQIDFFFHGYPRDLRELAWIYFGFNFKQVRKEIVTYDLGGSLLIDEEKYRHYFKELDRVKAEMHDFFRDTVIPEFYSENLWWSAMNERRQDKNSIFRIMLSKHYDPTVLGGHEETMKWLLSHEDEIKEMARLSFEETAGKSDSNEASDMRRVGVPQFLINKYQNSFSANEQKTIRAYFEKHPEAIEEMKRKKMSLGEIFKFLKKIFSQNMEGAR